MANDNRENDRVTREQYRQKRIREEDFQARDQRNRQQPVGSRYRRDEPLEEPSYRNPDDFKDERWHRTNSKLNHTILVLLVLIVIVYLILFFVN